MVIVRGIVLFVACGVLFAVGGGLIAVLLHQVAPGYYVGVFPDAAERGFAAEVGIGAGIIQGLMLGLLVGAVVALALGWFGQLDWISCVRCLAILAGSAALFALGGTVVGWGIGAFMPGYYRGVVSGGSRSGFNPTDVGVGLGCSQGVILGVLAGAVAVIALAWRQWRRDKPNSPPQPLRFTEPA